MEFQKGGKSHSNWLVLVIGMGSLLFGITDGRNIDNSNINNNLVKVQENDLVLTVGYSHPVKITCPQGIKFSVEKTVVNVTGVNKQLVGDVADKIRSVRPPEPYKGKGIKYEDEVVRRKPGKAAKAQAA